MKSRFRERKWRDNTLLVAIIRRHFTRFYIKPRIGDYILLNRNQGYLTHHTIFPCPDPVLGKGVLVQTTLWGNLILGPTARDMHNPEARGMSNESVQEYILSKCKKLCPYFDPKETIHAFAGAYYFTFNCLVIQNTINILRNCDENSKTNVWL